MKCSTCKSGDEENQIGNFRRKRSLEESINFLLSSSRDKKDSLIVRTKEEDFNMFLRIFRDASKKIRELEYSWGDNYLKILEGQGKHHKNYIIEIDTLENGSGRYVLFNYENQKVNIGNKFKGKFSKIFEEINSLIKYEEYKKAFEYC
jgi:hypothetical protein